MTEQFKVLYDYEADAPEELSLKCDEILSVGDKNENGWYKATNSTGQTGWIPSNYITPYTTDDIVKDEPAATENTSSEPAAEPAETADSKESKVCGGCKQTISGDFIIARDNKYFHIDHFVCSICSTSLAGKHYAMDGDMYFCIDDYHSTHSPKCAHCGQILKDKYITALGKTYHPEHFVCCICEQPFKDNKFRKKDNMPYCDKCYTTKFGTKCVKCGLIIMDKVFTAFNNSYHLSCFVCEVDGVEIGEGNPFNMVENKIYCTKHYEEVFLQKCNKCKKAIKESFIQVLNFYYHNNCFVCENCDKSLLNENFESFNDQFLCKDCFSELKKAEEFEQERITKEKELKEKEELAKLAKAPISNKPMDDKSSIESRNEALKALKDLPDNVKANLPANLLDKITSEAAVAETMNAEALANVDKPKPQPKLVSTDGISTSTRIVKPHIQKVPQTPTGEKKKDAAEDVVDVIVDNSTTIPYETLKNKDNLPANIQRTALERYLSPREFQQVFKMTLREFQSLKQWRQAQLKRALGLF